MLRGGWAAVVRVIAALDARKLLPLELSADAQLASPPPTPRSPSLVSDSAKKQQSSFSLTGLVGYLIGSGGSEPSSERISLTRR